MKRNLLLTAAAAAFAVASMLMITNAAKASQVETGPPVVLGKTLNSGLTTLTLGDNTLVMQHDQLPGAASHPPSAIDAISQANAAETIGIIDTHLTLTVAQIVGTPAPDRHILWPATSTTLKAKLDDPSAFITAMTAKDYNSGTAEALAHKLSAIGATYIWPNSDISNPAPAILSS